MALRSTRTLDQRPCPASTARGAVFTTSDQAGNAVSITIDIGQIQPADQLNDGLVDACSDDVSGVGSSMDRALAVPMSVHMQVISLPATITLHLADNYFATTDGPPENSSTNGAPFFFAKGLLALLSQAW